MNFVPGKRSGEIEITQVEYYTSALYPQPLTVEYINDTRPHRIPKRGQCPKPFNEWGPYERWWGETNDWFHKYFDYNCPVIFGGNLWSINVDWQPDPEQPFYKWRTYEDDIPGQTAAGIIAGVQIGTVFGWLHTFNFAKEAGIYQAAGMPPNMWLPIHKADWRFRARIFGTCQIQAATFFGAYQFVEAVFCRMRHKDDMWNQFYGGLGAGISLAMWFKNILFTVPLGICFGAIASSIRFAVSHEDTPKFCLDFDRPLWGVFGGPKMWFGGQEPGPDNWPYNMWGMKYRKWH
jgi:hypothetical protein